MNHKDRIYENAEEIKMSMQILHLLAISLYRPKYIHNLEMAYECDGVSQEFIIWNKNTKVSSYNCTVQM